jgi:hypothetical protein
MARGPSGQSHGPLARQDFEQGARSRDGTVEVHERRGHGLRGAGAELDALMPHTFGVTRTVVAFKMQEPNRHNL